MEAPLIVKVENNYRY